LKAKTLAISILGFPDAIYNKIRIEREYCPQAGADVGVAYSRWDYGVDRNAQGPSGSVVFFAALDSRKPSEWTVSRAFHGFVCM
jgi:hypothetical protein